jgi:hypothetical protein
MIGQHFNGLPNGRMVIACLKCGYKHDLAKWGWHEVVCQACREMVKHPISGIKTSTTKKIKTNLMLNKTSRDLIYTLSETLSCSQSEALNMVLKFAADEYRAAGGFMMHNKKDAKIWAKELQKNELEDLKEK